MQYATPTLMLLCEQQIPNGLMTGGADSAITVPPSRGRKLSTTSLNLGVTLDLATLQPPRIERLNKEATLEGKKMHSLK
jgi:hypothetical protein